MTSSILQARFMGTPSVRWQDGAPVHFPTQRALGLFAYLTMQGQRGAARDDLAELLWPGRGDGSARAALRRTVYELKTALGDRADEVLVVGRDRLAIVPGRVQSDVARIGPGRAAGPRDDATPGQDGLFLSGVHFDAPPFEDWLADQQRRLSQSQADMHRDLAARKLADGRFEEAAGIAEALVRQDPADEAARRLLMRALSATGARARALEQFDDLCGYLSAELGAEPEERTRDLCDHIRRGARMLPGDPLQRPSVPSIAVLPFVNRTGADDQDYVVDGLFEGVATELSRDRSLFVISTGTMAMYKGLQVQPREIAAELGVRYVVEGRVRMDPDRMRLDVELVDGVRGAMVFSRTYERARPELLRVQDEVVSEIVATLRGYKGAIQRSELQRSRSKPDMSLTAYEHLMRGMALKERFLKDEMREARGWFERAIAIEPDMAMAHGWLAWTHFFEVYMGWTDRPDAALTETFASARRAVDLDPDLDFAHWALGAAHLAAGDCDRALAGFGRALELNPNNSDALANMAWPLMFTGRADEAEATLARAMRLNPFYPDWYSWGLGMARFARGDAPGAVAALEDMAHHNDQSLAVLVAARMAAGQPDKARGAAAELRRVAPHFCISSLLNGLGFRDDAIRRRLHDALSAQGLPA